MFFLSNKNKFVFLLLISFLASVSIFAKPKTIKLENKPGIQSLIKSVLELDDLTDQQQEKIQTILTQRADKTRELQDKSINLMRNYLDEALQENTKGSALIKRNKELDNNYQTLRNYQLETWLLVKSQLNSKQLIKLRDRQKIVFALLSKSKNPNFNPKVKNASASFQK